MESQDMKPVVMELQDETLIITQNNDNEEEVLNESDSNERTDSAEEEMETDVCESFDPGDTHVHVDSRDHTYSYGPSITPVEVNQVLACGLCDHVCDSSVQLMTHMKSHETDRVAVEQKPCVCMFCQEVLSLEYVAHHFHKHSLSMPNTTCMVCGLVFISVESLRVHLQFHKGRRPENLAHNKAISTNQVTASLYTNALKCGYCSRKFSSTFALKNHVNECTDCKISLKSRTQLNLLARSKIDSRNGIHEILIFHLKTNETYPKNSKKKLSVSSNNEKCEICGTTYQLRSSLHRHLRNVHGLDPAQISVAASNSSNLSIGSAPPRKNHNGNEILEQTMTSVSSTISSNTDKVCVLLGLPSQTNKKTGPEKSLNLISQKFMVTVPQTLISQSEMITGSQRLTSQSEKPVNTKLTIQQGKIYLPPILAKQKEKTSVPQRSTFQVGETVGSQSSTNQEAEMSHNSESNFFRCEICYKAFNWKSSIVRHMQIFHGIELSSSSESQEEEVLIGNSRDTSLLQIVNSRQEGTDQCWVQQKDQQNNSAMIMRLDPENFDTQMLFMGNETAATATADVGELKNESPFKCPPYDEVFEDGRYLKDHNLMSHAGDFCSCGKSDNQIPNPVEQNTSMEDSGHIGRNAESNTNLCHTCGGFIVQRRQTTEILKKDINQTSKISTYPWKECYCVICGKFLAHRKSLRRHIRKIHHIYGQELDQATQHVGQQKSSTSLTDTQKPGFCDICGKYFVCRNSVGRHKRKVHHIYGQDFSQVTKFVRYETEQASLCSDESVTESFEPEDKSSEDQLTMVTYKCVCHICKKQFVGKGKMKQQAREHGSNADLVGEPALKQTKLEIIGDGCEGGNNNRQQTSTSYQSCESVGSKFVCDTCEKAFSCSKNVEGHRTQLSRLEFNEQVKSAKQMYPKKMFLVFLADECEKKRADTDVVNNLVCNICKQVFAQPHSVKRHMKRFHRREMREEQTCAIKQSDVNKFERKHKLGESKKKEKSEDANSNHLNRLTKLSNKCVCNICRRVFPNKASARRHRQKVHTRELLKQARHAGHLNPAARPSNGRSHMRTIHAKENEVVNVNHRFESVQKIQSTKVVNKCVCNICRRVFPNKALARRHKQKVHTRELQQARHMKQVSSNKQSFDGEDVKECIETEKKEDTESSVQIQQSTELENNFKCSLCNLRFSYQYSVERHKKKKHPKELRELRKCVIAEKEESEKTQIEESRKEVEHSDATVEEADLGNTTHNLLSYKISESEKMPKKFICVVKCTKLSADPNIKSSKRLHVTNLLDCAKPVSETQPGYEFACDICGKHFAYKRNIKPHKQRCHTGKSQKASSSDLSRKYSSVANFARLSTNRLKESKTSHARKLLERAKRTRQHDRMTVAPAHAKSTAQANEFRCDICNQRFSHKKSIKRHKMVIHHISARELDRPPKHPKEIRMTTSVHAESVKVTSELRCNICNLRFAHKKSIKRHKERFHSRELEEQEKHNKVLDKSEQVERHTDGENAGSSEIDDKLKCNFCDKVFVHRSNVNRHKKLYHAREIHELAKQCCKQNKSSLVQTAISKFQCRYCKQVYKWKQDLKRHTMKHHAEELYEEAVHNRPTIELANLKGMKKPEQGHDDGEAKEESGSSVKTTISQFQCNYCERVYKWKQDLKRHTMRNHAEELCEEAVHNRPKVELTYLKGMKKPKQSHDDDNKRSLNTSESTAGNEFKCDICNKSFMHPKNIKRHKLLTHSVGMYDKTKLFKNDKKCDICRKVFARPWNMREHRRIAHGVKKLVKSKEKVKSFKSKAVRNTTKEDMRHRFKGPTSIEDRKNRHSSSSSRYSIGFLTEFVCDICDQVFVHQKSIKYHKEKFHAEELKKKADRSQDDMMNDQRHSDIERSSSREQAENEDRLQTPSSYQVCKTTVVEGIVSQQPQNEKGEQSGQNQNDGNLVTKTYKVNKVADFVNELPITEPILEHGKERGHNQSNDRVSCSDSEETAKPAKKPILDDPNDDDIGETEQNQKKGKNVPSSSEVTGQDESSMKEGEINNEEEENQSQDGEDGPAPEQEINQEFVESSVESQSEEGKGISECEEQISDVQTDKGQTLHESRDEPSSETADVKKSSTSNGSDVEGKKHSTLEHSAVESSEESEHCQNDCDKAAHNSKQNPESDQTGETSDVQKVTSSKHFKNDHDESESSRDDGDKEEPESKPEMKRTGSEAGDSIKDWSWMRVL